MPEEYPEDAWTQRDFGRCSGFELGSLVIKHQKKAEVCQVKFVFRFSVRGLSWLRLEHGTGLQDKKHGISVCF